MRKKLTVALAAVLVLAFAGIALAKQIQTADIKFSKSKAGGPTAIDSTFKVSDPANQKAGEVGKPTVQITQVDINFPKGMKFNYKVVPQCTIKATYDAIVKYCKKAKLATGSTKIDGRNGPLGAIITGTLTAYNRPNGLYILVHSSNAAVDKQVLPPTLKGTKLVTKLPTALKLVNAYLTDFHLNIPIKGKKVKGKKQYYATLPKKCPKSGKFVVKTKYYFDGGGSFTTPGTVNKCKK